MKRYLSVFALVLLLCLMWSAAGGPVVGFWIAPETTSGKLTPDSTFTTSVGFGTMNRNAERFMVEGEANDFEIELDCPDEYIVDDVNYAIEDFMVDTYARDKNFDQLPQRFQMTIARGPEKENYSGVVTLHLEEFSVGGYTSAHTELYYYGDSSLVCFDARSEAAAKRAHGRAKIGEWLWQRRGAAACVIVLTIVFCAFVSAQGKKGRKGSNFV